MSPKTQNFGPLFCVAVCCGLLADVQAQTLIITTDTTVSASDTSTIDGKDVTVIAGVTLTVSGTHNIASIQIAGVVTHSVGDCGGVALKVAGLLDVQAGGKIDVTARGCRGSWLWGNFTDSGETWDPSCGCTTNGGAGGAAGSYGSAGEKSRFGGYTNPLYGMESHPAELGSGGGASAFGCKVGGNGGGRVDIEAQALALNGQILANGEVSWDNCAGSGSGGAIYIVINGGSFSGTGTVEAGGGSAAPNSGQAGGDGRIAIVGYTTNAFAGTIGRAATVFLSPSGEYGRLTVDGTIITITNGETRVWHSLSARNKPSAINNQGTMVLGSDELFISSLLPLVQDGVIKGAARTNDVIGSFTVLPGGVVTHTRGLLRGLQLNVDGKLEVKTGGKIDVSSKGCRGSGNGSLFAETWAECCGCTTNNGAGQESGGSYGTLGGGPSPNATYGNPLAPAELGSGAWALNPIIFDTGGNGGGRVGIMASDLVVDGDIVADGQFGSSIASGGSGGAIFIQINGGIISGAGKIHANGGLGPVQPGGGGRIAIVGFRTNAFTGTLGSQGTIFLPGVPGILYQGTNLVISWGSLFAGFQLESNNAPSSTNAWSLVTNTPVMLGDQYTITLTAPGSSRFFRLSKP